MDSERYRFCVGLLLPHCERLLGEQAGDPAMCAVIKQLMQGEPLRQSVELAVQAIQEVFVLDEDGVGVTKEGGTEDFFIAVSFFRNARLPIAARSFAGGYCAWLAIMLHRAERLPGRPALAHWILIQHAGDVATHLTLTQQDKRANKVLAWDLLNSSEMREMFGPVDPRPAHVKAQWGLPGG